MNENEEKQYRELNAKFHKELAELEAEIEKLGERANVLNALLYGEPAVFEEELPPYNLTDEGEDIPEEDEPAPEPVEAIRRLEKTEGNNEERAKIDKDLIAFLEKNQGSTRAEINAGLKKKGWSPWDVDKSIKRCRTRQAIIREGATRNAHWYTTEEVV